jgi:transcriptional regulator with XRE-family HTH domain
MGPPIADVTSPSATLAQALKALRRLRGMRPVDVARAMGMPLRSYEYFESGRGRLNVDRIHQVAQILNADAFAILAAMEIRSPAFAVRCAANKLMTILTMALQDFDAGGQDDIARLDPHTLISAFTQVFDGLTKHARERDAFVERWMADKGLQGPGRAPDD